MKRILSLFGVLLFGLGLAQAQITTFPYNEDFETFTNCGTSCTSTCNLPVASGWTNAATANRDWIVDNGGTGSGGTGPSVDHNPGTSAGKYLYTESSSPCSSPGSSWHLVSPEFDLSGLTDPAVSFWYHMLGGSMGTMHLDMSLDNGATWINDIVPGWTDNVNLWQERKVCLNGSAAAGAPSVRFRIRGLSGTSFTSDMAVDDFSVFSNPPTGNSTDVGVTAIVSPTPGFATGLGNEIIQVEITNFDPCNPIPAGATIPVSYTLNGNTVNETFTAASAISGSQSVVYSFATPGNFTATCQVYTLSARTNLAGDTNTANDQTGPVNVTHIGLVNTFPYEESFEGTNGCWLDGGNGLWQHGVPAGGVINTAYTGNEAYVTNLTGNYPNLANEQRFLYSPIFDFSSLTDDPVFRFAQNIDIETCCDEGWLDISFDGGQNWTRLDNAASLNWYNDNLNQWWDENTSGWREVGVLLSGAAGQSNVMLRHGFSSDGSVTREGFAIDAISIRSDMDIAITDITSPVSGTSLFTPQSVTAVVENLGTATVRDPEITFTLTGPTGTQTVTEIATGLVLQPFAVTNYTFATSVDLSFIGLYDVTASINVPNDINPANNSFTVQVEHNAVTVQSVCANSLPDMTFETGDEGWFAQALPDASTPAWLPGRGTPLAALPVPGPGEGNFSFLTDPAGANGGSNYGANSSDSWGGVIAVFSPVFDFSQLVPPLTLEFLMSVSSNTVDAAWLEYSIDGGNTWKWFGDANSNANVPGALNWYNRTDYSQQLPSGPPSPTPGVWNGMNNVSPASDWLPRAHPYPADCFGEPDVRLRFMLSNTTAEPAIAWGIDGISRPCIKPAMPLITLEADSVVKPEVDSVGIRVEWTDLAVLDPIDEEQNFYLQRTTGDPTVDNGNWDLIAVLPSDSLVYFDRAVMGGVEYHYRVQALFANGLGEYSNTDSSSVPPIDPPAPYEPMLTGTPGHQSVDLEWPSALPVHGIREFEIFFGVGIDYANVRIASVDEEVNAYTVIGLVNGFDYAFQYRPVYDDFTKGVMSNVVMLRPSIILNSDEALTQNDVKVFPNPNNGSFRLALSRQPQGEFTVRVLSVTGQELYREAFTGENGDFQTEIQLDNVSNGLYLLNVETENGTIQKKVSILR